MSAAPGASVLGRLRGRPDTEHEMSFNRLAFALVISVYLFSQDAPPLAQAISALYWVVAIGLFAHILRWPGTSIPRRITALTLDMVFLSAELHVGGEITAAFVPIYLWVILGNGFRFGVAWLRGAMAIAGFLAVWVTTPFWHQQPHLSAGFLLGLVAIPANAGTLIRKLDAARRQAEQASQAKSMFLASVSHELRTPLNAIIGMGELLERSRLDAEQREMARTVTDAGRNLLGLIDGILDFSRIEAGRMAVNPVPLDLAALLSEAGRLLGRQAEEKGLRLLFHITPRTPRRLLADPRLLRELVLNLAGNAVKFTETGSVVVALDAEPDEAGDALRLRLEVTDTGIGIAPEAQKRIFESFTQADATIMNRYGGTGLGLAICRRIAEGLGGTIGVESAPGAGSTFRCTLPLRRDPTPAAPPAGEAVLLRHGAGERAEGLAPPGVILRPAAGLSEAVALLQGLPPGAPRVLVAARSVLGASAEDAARTLALLDPPGRWRIVLLEEGAADGLPEMALRRAALAVLPAEPAADALAAALGFAFALGAPAEAPADAPAAEARSLSVLVADDNKVNRRVVQRILESAGHRVTLVANGEEALDALEEARFDLVLMDLNMPVLDGIEAAKLYQVQSLGRRRVPILALTADATPEARRRCLEAGMAGCLTKPITPASLLEAVRAHALAETPAAAAGPVADIASHPRFRPSGLPALDEGALADLDALGGPEFVEGVVQEFLADAEGLLAELGRAAAAGDAAAFRAKAHALRSSAANVGARALGELCRVGQDISLAELAAAGAQQVERLAAELARARQALLRRTAAPPAARQT
ncbi:MAG: ATP-binding protein [Acetobacteraceae bacterium]|nr:ATP-binding protein [Acetobacteraceae bacterium]